MATNQGVQLHTLLGSFFRSVKAVKMPTPGAMEYGFASEYLAAHPVAGPGIFFRKQFLNFAAGQNYQQAIAAVQTGVGGLASGQMILQPLSDPYNGA